MAGSNATGGQPSTPREAICPRCGQKYTYASLAEHKAFPFCSPRCRDIDLGNWLTEKYAIPGQPVEPVQEQDDEDDEGRVRQA
jgi:hypothetical protein